MADGSGSAAIHEDHPDLAQLAAEGRVVAYFGYGSLVNKRTLRTRFLGIRRATATGWRRFWLPRPSGEAALLSVRPREEFRTQGVVVYDLADHLPSVDEREAGYIRRVVLPSHVEIEAAPGLDIPLFLYEAAAGAPDAEDLGSPILQSYLDAVLQGFLSLYGEAGVARFIEETEGFETTVIRDRGKPRYPRSVSLKEEESLLFDTLLTRRGVGFVDGS